MADKSFGVKELNLLNASGTPKVTAQQIQDQSFHQEQSLAIIVTG